MTKFGSTRTGTYQPRRRLGTEIHRAVFVALRFDDRWFRGRRYVWLHSTVRAANANWHVRTVARVRFIKCRIGLSFCIFVARRLRDVDVCVPDNRSLSRVLELCVSFMSLGIQWIVEALAWGVGWAGLPSSESRVMCVVIFSIGNDRGDRGNTDGNTEAGGIQIMR